MTTLDMEVLAKEIGDIIDERIADLLPKQTKMLQSRIRSLEGRIRELEVEHLAPRITQLEDLLTDPVAGQ